MKASVRVWAKTSVVLAAASPRLWLEELGIRAAASLRPSAAEALRASLRPMLAKALSRFAHHGALPGSNPQRPRQQKARHHEGDGLVHSTGGELGIRPPLRCGPALRRPCGPPCDPCWQRRFRALLTMGPSRVRIPSALGSKKPATARVTGLCIQLAESWGFEPQIPLWGILA